jgi:signal transduction histidine kinase
MGELETYILAHGKHVLVSLGSSVSTIGAGRGFQCVMLMASMLLLAAADAVAQSVPKQILMLQSVDRGNMVVDTFTTNFHVELDQHAELPVNFVQVVVGPIGQVGAPEQAILDFVLSTFAGGPKPDLIVAVSGPAAIFARKYRQQLFPDTPLLFAAVDERYLRAAPLGENETAVAVRNDFPRLIDDILQVLPETRHIFVVAGTGQIGQFWRNELEAPFSRFRGRLTFEWPDKLSLSEILRRCASLPDHSAIFYLMFGTDAAGSAYADERVLADLRATANAPVFGGQSVHLGAGSVGGTMLSIDILARNTADVALRLLNGATPGSIRVPPQRPSQPIFDWRELDRWGIPESRLPSGSVVRFRAPSLWRVYRGTVLTAAGVVAVQSLLIAGLLYQRRARQRAENDSRRNLALAADASRRETMSALNSSIGHELGQPLGSIVSNAQALQMMVTANRATSDTIGEILTDIQTQGVRATEIIDRHRTMLKSHQLDKKPIDVHAVIKETLGLVEHNMSMRQVEARMNLSSSPCVIDGDPLLLQQVFVNLVLNALDAMTDTPPAQRRVTISSDVRTADVDVSVRDTGPGLPADRLDKLFMPFVTTKPHGLGIGLTIVQTIVDAHGGIVVARNHPEGGAILTVTLRRSASVSAAGALDSR